MTTIHSTSGPRRNMEKDARAAEIIDRFHAGEDLAPFLPGEPSGAAALDVADLDAPRVMAALGRLYGVGQWDYDLFKELYVKGALATWKPGTVVTEDERVLRVESPGCPILADVARDPRVCQACQLLHEGAARIAMTDAVESVAFERLVPRGDDSCVMVVRRSPPA